jgi:capsule polysaccharide export protein KpsE/RkpR
MQSWIVRLNHFYQWSLSKASFVDRYASGNWSLSLKHGILAVGLSVLYSLTQVNHYVSTAIILPADSKSGGMLGNLGGAVAAASALGISAPEASSDNASVDILNSRPVREALLNTVFDFNIKYFYFDINRPRQQTLYRYLGASNMDNAVKRTRKFITINRDPKTKIITIQVETESPQLSQQIAKRLVQLLNDFFLTKSQTKGSVQAAFSEKRLQEGRAELDRAEENLRKFLTINRNYTDSTDPEVRLKGLRLENELKLQTQLVTSLALSREDALLREKNDMPILNILDEGNLPINKSRPKRVINALLMGVLAFLGTLGWMRRHELKALLVKSLGD